MFTKSLEVLIGECYRNARNERHEFMGPEHLLLALLSDTTVRDAIVSCNGDSAAIEADLVVFINDSANVLSDDDDRDTQPTLGFQRILQRAVYHVQSSGKREVTPLNCLVAMFGEKDSYAVSALAAEDIDRLDIVNYVAHGMKKDPPPAPLEKIERIADGATNAKPEGVANASSLRVFISYSHKDSCCRDRLLIHLRPLEKNKKIDSWSDQRIRPGDKWKEEIAENIEQAAVAVLLLSADFLASEFIVDHELQPLLISAEAKGIRIIPVVLKPCGFLRDKLLRNFQSINDPRAPLLGLNEIDQEHLYDKIANEIHEELLLREK